MYEHYRVLDLQPTATTQEIKTQFTRLARIYDPARFSDEHDRALAAQKLEELEAAYAALTQEVAETGHDAPPKPVVTPGHVDFGTVTAGERVTRRVEISNGGGEVHALTYAPGAKNTWYKLTAATPLDPPAALPLELEVEVDTAGLPQDWSHMGWFDVNMDGIVVRVTLEVNVTAAKRTVTFPRWAAIGGAVAAALLVGWLAVSALDLTNVSLPSLRFDRLVASPATSAWTRGDRFVFAAMTDGRPTLQLADIEGNEQIDLEIIGRSVTVAPGTQHIAFTAPVAGYEQVFLLSAGAKEPVQMTTGPGNKQAPRWSPDGTRIAVAVSHEGRWEIRLLDAHAPETERAVATLDSAIGGVSWSPDGTQLAVGGLYQEGARVHIIALSTVGAERAATARDSAAAAPVPLTTFDSWDPVWSPDGTRIAVASPRGLYTLEPDGRNLQRLNVQPAQTPQWSPAGDQIGFLSAWNNAAGKSSLWAVDSAGGKAVRRTPPEQDVVAFTWLPDEMGVAYSIAQSGSDGSAYQLWRLPPTAAPYVIAQLADTAAAWLSSID